MSEHWIVTRTKPKAEFIAQMNLQAQGYDVYLPLAAIDGTIQPLLPGYCFVDVSPRDGLWRPVNNTRGISGYGVLMTGERPSRVPERDIETMKLREEGGAIHIRTKPVKVPYEKGQTVRILDGAFGGLDAIFDHAESKDRLILFVECMGRIVPLETTMRNVA